MLIFLRFFVLIILGCSLISCQPRNLEDGLGPHRHINIEDREFSYFDAFSKIVDDYKKIIQEYKVNRDEFEKQALAYHKMLEVSYQINKKYSEYVDKQSLNLEDLKELQSHVEELSEVLKDFEASDEIQSMLETIKADLEILIEKVSPVDIEWGFVDTASDESSSGEDMGDFSSEPMEEEPTPAEPTAEESAPAEPMEEEPAPAEPMEEEPAPAEPTAE